MDIPLKFNTSFISGDEEVIQSFLLNCMQSRGVSFVPRLYGYTNSVEKEEVLHRIADSYGIRIISYINNSLEFEFNGKKYKRELIK